MKSFGHKKETSTRINNQLNKYYAEKRSIKISSKLSHLFWRPGFDGWRWWCGDRSTTNRRTTAFFLDPETHDFSSVLKG